MAGSGAPAFGQKFGGKDASASTFRVGNPLFVSSVKCSELFRKYQTFAINELQKLHKMRQIVSKEGKILKRVERGKRAQRPQNGGLTRSVPQLQAPYHAFSQINAEACVVHIYSVSIPS